MKAIIEMLDGFPTEAPEGLLQQLYAESAKFTESVIQETCQRFKTGRVEGQNKRFAPSVPEWVDEAVRVKGWQERPTEYKPIQFVRRESVSLETLDEEFHGCDVLADDLEVKSFVALRRAGRLPEGSIWAMGRVYGPPAKERVFAKVSKRQNPQPHWQE